MEVEKKRHRGRPRKENVVESQSDYEAPKSKFDKIQEGVGVWTSYYRENPDEFAIDYFGMVWMADFQKILLILIVTFTYVMIIASRGMGKTMIVAAAICVKCTLRPGLKVCIAAGKRNQSLNVLKKIVDEYMPASPNLTNEIKSYKVTQSDAYIEWKNGSKVTVVTANQNARSERAHWVISDEFVQIPKAIIDKVIRKFKAGQRRPGFYNNPKYKNYPKESNTETYISSAFYKFHYSWAKFCAFFKSMIKEESYICCGFPYQLPVKAGYYPEEQIREEMQEDDFDEIAWSMEMDSLFFGESEKAYFSYEDVGAVRRIVKPTYPLPYYSKLNDSKFKPPMKSNGEIRLITVDVATSGGNKNDATSIALIQLLPMSDRRFKRNVSYIEELDGGHGTIQAIRIKQLYEDLQADFVVVDTNGVGITVYDSLVEEQFDEDRNCRYDAWSCINDPNMAKRSSNPALNKYIYSIKATTALNNDMAVSLKNNMRSGKINFLIDEIEGGDILETSSKYRQLPVEDQMTFLSPYKLTTTFRNESINLDYEIVDGNKIRVTEQSSMRKDHYSAIAYGNYVANLIERDAVKKQEVDLSDIPSCVTPVEF